MNSSPICMHARTPARCERLQSAPRLHTVLSMPDGAPWKRRSHSNAHLFAAVRNATLAASPSFEAVSAAAAPASRASAACSSAAASATEYDADEPMPAPTGSVDHTWTSTSPPAAVRDPATASSQMEPNRNRKASTASRTVSPSASPLTAAAAAASSASLSSPSTGPTGAEGAGAIAAVAAALRCSWLRGSGIRGLQRCGWRGWTSG